MCKAVSLFVLVRKKGDRFLQEAVCSGCMHLKSVKIMNIYNYMINIKKTIDVLK